MLKGLEVLELKNFGELIDRLNWSANLDLVLSKLKAFETRV